MLKRNIDIQLFLGAPISKFPLLTPPPRTVVQPTSASTSAKPGIVARPCTNGASEQHPLKQHPVHQSTTAVEQEENKPSRGGRPATRAATPTQNITARIKRPKASTHFIAAHQEPLPSSLATTCKPKQEMEEIRKDGACKPFLQSLSLGELIPELQSEALGRPPIDVMKLSGNLTDIAVRHPPLGPFRPDDYPSLFNKQHRAIRLATTAALQQVESEVQEASSSYPVPGPTKTHISPHFVYGPPPPHPKLPPKLPPHSSAIARPQKPTPPPLNLTPELDSAPTAASSPPSHTNSHTGPGWGVFSPPPPHAATPLAIKKKPTPARPQPLHEKPYFQTDGPEQAGTGTLAPRKAPCLPSLPQLSPLNLGFEGTSLEFVAEMMRAVDFNPRWG